jgi:hypothetical protein
MTDLDLDIERSLPDLQTLLMLGTLALLVLYAQPAIAPFFLPLVLIGLFLPGWRTRPLFWGAVTALMALGNVAYFEVNDDHQFLFNYWTLALALCLTIADDQRRRAAFAFNGRILLGLTFALAVFWKLTAADFRTGHLFEYLLHFDHRFAHIATTFTELSHADIAHNRAVVQGLRLESIDAASVEHAVRTAPSVPLVADLMTWGAAVVEGSVAVFCLAPRTELTRKLAHAAIFAFLMTTYVIVPVIGFAAIIILLGLAQCRPDEKKLQLGYVGLFVILPLIHELTAV